MFNPSYIILRKQTLDGNSVDPDEVTHGESPYLDLHCLQIPSFFIIAATSANFTE